MADEIEAGVAAMAVTASTETIELDIGGTVFKTALSTLRRHPTSFFGALVRNRGSSTRLFIDRDPTYFRHVLNFMRTGYVTTPSDEDAKREFLLEAEFYGLASFARAIRAPELDLSKHLAAVVLEEREKESLVRAVFATNDASKIARLSPHEALVDFFRAYSRGVSFAAAPPCDASSTLLFDLMQPTAPLGREGSPASCTSLNAFESNYNALFPDVLDRLSPLINQDGIFIAGGSVLLALTIAEPVEPPTSNWWNRPPRRTCHTTSWGLQGDVDIFLPACASDAKATLIANRIWIALAVDGEFWKMERTRGVINLTKYGSKYSGPYQTPQLIVQIVLRRYASPAEVLLCFDVDCCAVGYGSLGPYTPRALWAAPRAVRALQTGRNVVNALHAWPCSPAYEIRLCKYACRGFSVYCPGLDPRRVDQARLRGAEFPELAGAARLLRLASVLEPFKPRTFAEAKSYMISKIFHSEEGLRFHLSALYDLPVRSLPGEEPINKAAEWSELPDVLASSTADEAASIRVSHPRDIAWTTLAPKDNYEDGDDPCPCFVNQASPAVRTAVWRGIADAGHDHLEIPRRLNAAWDDTRNQREYINSKDPLHDAVYYAHAYTM